ncbi:MAG: magnesium/cobalt transporter CorA [Chthoniobacterales bacterium]|nr:magnesium/cobalt transporter CorA [Chthoniobacterales bacterium]
MFKKRRHVVPGEAPGLLKLSQDSPKKPPVITLIEYGPDSLEERKDVECDELLVHLNNELLTWINIDGLGDLSVLRILGERFNLHPLALEDVLDTNQRPKVEQYDDYLFIIAKMIYLGKNMEIDAEQVSMFLGNTFLITLQEEADFDVFEPVRARIRAGKGRIRKAGSDYLAYALLDSIIDHYFPALESIGMEIDTIEDELVDNPLVRPVGSLHGHKRTLTQIRRMVWPLRDVTNLLLHEDSGLIRPETKIYLRDCYDHSVQLMDVVESYRDVLSGLTEIHISSIGLRTNEIMRILTVISAIFIPLTFVAGVYGMNFEHMPELAKPWGYFACLALMLAIAVGQLIYFKKRSWL